MLLKLDESFETQLGLSLLQMRNDAGLNWNQVEKRGGPHHWIVKQMEQGKYLTWNNLRLYLTALSKEAELSVVAGPEWF
jgi:hypothetical protein